MTNRIEKFVLRAAFKEWLPDSILWRNKEGFSEALGKIDLGDVFQKYCDSFITDLEFSQRNNLFKWHTPQTKEEYWFRLLFEKFFDLQKVDSVIHVKVYRYEKKRFFIKNNVLELHIGIHQLIVAALMKKKIFTMKPIAVLLPISAKKKKKFVFVFNQLKFQNGPVLHKKKLNNYKKKLF